MSYINEKDVKRFTKFLKSVGLYKDGELLVDIDPVQDNEQILSASIKGSAKDIRKILEKSLGKKAKKKESKFHQFWTLKVKGRGWIIIEKYSGDAYLTLINKWW